MSAVPEREYLIRVTRHPLDPVLREQMRNNGTLPEDYRSRSVEATDFVTVHAADDQAALTQARTETRLVTAGETLSFDEALSEGGFRPLETE